MLEVMQVSQQSQNSLRILFNMGKDVFLTLSFKDFSDAFVNSELSKQRTHIQHELEAPAVRHSSN